VKVSSQEIEQRQVVLEVEVDEERLQRALDQAYKRIVNRINVPGFRKGRAPRPLVERMVGREAIFEDAVEHLVPQVYQDALKEQQISAAGKPSVEVTGTEPLQFKATVPLEPKVELGDYRSIKADVESIAVEQHEVQAVLDNFREANATWSPVDRAARVGDRVGLAVKATRDGQTITDSPDAEFILNPDGPEPAPGFSQQLVGVAAGEERTFDLRATEPSEDAPALTRFQVKLHWVKEKELAELDDEFAQAVSERDTLEALRDEIHEQIRRRKEELARERQTEALVQAAVDQARIEAPPQAVEQEANQILNSLAARLDKQGISLEQYLQFSGKDEATFKSELLADAERTLKRSLVLEAIARAEGLGVDEAEVRDEVERAAQSASDPRRTAREALRRPETRARIESIIRTRKGFRRLAELAGAVPSEATPSAVAEVSEPTGESNVQLS
jgi:trigger factor